MRISQKMVEFAARNINKDGKIVHVSHRNDYYAIDNAKEDENYQCGLTTREAYLVLKGIQAGIQAGIQIAQGQIDK